MFLPSLPARPPVTQSAPGRARSLLAAGALGALLALLGACGAPSPAGDNAQATIDAASDGEHEAVASDSHGMSSAAGSDDAGDRAYAFGEPGLPADSSQVIEITATDAQTFEPAAVDVPLGATVTFRVTNSGGLTHEFVLGDEPFQATHEAEMAGMAHDGETMHDEPYGFQLQPAQTKDLVWRFTAPGEFVYACHTPGHYAVGMRGTVTVK